MENIPRRHFLLIPSRAWSVISKSIDKDVPKRLKPINKQRLRKWNPDVIHYKITALEIASL